MTTKLISAALDSPRGHCVRETLRHRGIAWLRVSGSSMVPWIRPGDILWIRRVELAQVRTVDVVLLLRGQQLIVHRVVSRGHSAVGHFLLTKGDAAAEADPPVAAAELLGRVAGIELGRRRVSLESRPQRALGRLLAQVSFLSRFWYPAAGRARRFLHRALRRSA